LAHRGETNAKKKICNHALPTTFRFDSCGVPAGMNRSRTYDDVPMADIRVDSPNELVRQPRWSLRARRIIYIYIHHGRPLVTSTARPVRNQTAFQRYPRSLCSLFRFRIKSKTTAVDKPCLLVRAIRVGRSVRLESCKTRGITQKKCVGARVPPSA